MAPFRLPCVSGLTPIYTVQIMVEYIWEVKAKNAPYLKRKCNRCNSGKFYCSNKFRVNAQKKCIDVWLIYKCVKCDSTYNMTILSRTNPEQINKELLSKFFENDEALAMKYAFSSETLRRNYVEADYGSVEYEIRHEDISIDSILNADEDIIKIKVQMPFDLKLKLSTLVRSCLGLSASRFARMEEAEAVYMQDLRLLKKYRVRNGDIIFIDKNKLEAVLK